MGGQVARSDLIAPPAEAFDAPVSDSAAGPIRLGIACVLVFFLGFGGWAAMAPLNSAVVADGVLTVEGGRRSVQHLEGGIVKEIKVRDGDFVQAGEPLLVLDDTTARAQYDLYYQQLVLTRATEARLTAELGDTAEIAFPTDMLDSTDPLVAKAIQSQRTALASGREALAGNRAILNRRIDQLVEQSAGDDAIIRSYEDQVASMQAERTSLEGLLKSGLATRTRILDLERNMTALRGQIGDAQAARAANDQHIAEFRQQIQQLTSDRQSDISKSLDDTEARILDLAPQLHNAQSLLERMVIRAPAEGKVVGLGVHAAGAVIAPGAVLMDIVPVRSSLIIEARIAVQDISDLRPGMPAEVRFTSYQPRSTPLIRATVAELSADRITDDRTLAAYYQAEIDLDPKDLAANPQILLYPGMPATVMITTQERTALDYLLGPLASSFDRAFKQR